MADHSHVEHGHEEEHGQGHAEYKKVNIASQQIPVFQSDSGFKIILF
jgi:hypothetical protein